VADGEAAMVWWWAWGVVVDVVACDGSAERKDCAIKFGQSYFRENFAGHHCIVFIFADSFVSRVPFKYDLQVHFCRERLRLALVFLALRLICFSISC
jgi:hypothetical protein